MTAYLPPINLSKWVEENKDHLKPPVCNKVIYEAHEDFIVMIVGGPNTRKDFHINESEELFYQFKGDMNLKMERNGEIIDQPIREGEIFLLPANVPHSPQRYADTIGLVVEKKRSPEMTDAFQWYCDNCQKPLYKVPVKLKNIVTQLPPLFESFWSDSEKTKCSHCGHITTK